MFSGILHIFDGILWYVPKRGDEKYTTDETELELSNKYNKKDTKFKTSF